MTTTEQVKPLLSKQMSGRRRISGEAIQKAAEEELAIEKRFEEAKLSPSQNVSCDDEY